MADLAVPFGYDRPVVLRLLGVAAIGGVALEACILLAICVSDGPHLVLPRYEAKTGARTGRVRGTQISADYAAYSSRMPRGYRDDLPPIVASWPASSVWVVATGAVYSGLPGRPGSFVSVALPPRRKTDSVHEEIAAGLDPESLAFGRRTRTTDRFHAQFRTVLTDIDSIAIAPVEGAPERKVLVVRLRQGGMPAFTSSDVVYERMS